LGAIISPHRNTPSVPRKDREKDSWESLYRSVKSARPLAGCRALLAYNTVLDRVVKVDERLLSKLPKPSKSRRPRRVSGIQDFADALAFSIRRNVAVEVVCEPKVFAEISKLGPYKEQIGGQVAIIANLLSKFQRSAVIVHADRFDARAAALYRKTKALVALPSHDGMRVIPAEKFVEEVEPEAHYIFEYGTGTAFASGRPGRNNRMIACPTTPIEFQTDWEEVLPELAPLVDVAFLAGLNHMGDDYEGAFARVAEHIRLLRLGNPRITIHLELTSTQELMKLEKILDIVVRKVDSVGLNEGELRDVMDCLGHKPERGPLGQVEGMLALMGLGPKRVHLHTMGYYLCKVRGKEEPARDGMLCGALIGAAAALKGGIPGPKDLDAALRVPVSERGLDMLKAFEQVWLRQDSDELATKGYLEGFGLAAVPTKIVPEPKGTVGLGDMVSSSSLAAELAFRNLR
jgi:ADP-dependent phosphofructokinase/glucokinase